MKTALKAALSVLLSSTMGAVAYGQNDALFVAPSGNVGIGTTGPEYKLTLGPGKLALGVENGSIFYAKNKDGRYFPFLWPRWEDNRMYISYGNVGLTIRNDDERNALVIDSRGYIGVGVNTPKSALEVKGRIRDSSGYVMPVGSIIAYGGNTAPDGWLLCDGQSCKNYPDLQKVVGDNVPDLRGRFIVGVGQGKESNYTLKQTGGAEKVTLDVNEMPRHSHEVLANTGSNGGSEHAARGRYNIMQGDRDASYNLISNGDKYFIKPAGGGQPHENRPPFYALTYIIKY